MKRTDVSEEIPNKSKEIPKEKKGKGKGKSLSKKHTAADIRDESTAEKEKQKRIDKKSWEKQAEEEDPDLPTKKLQPQSWQGRVS